MRRRFASDEEVEAALSALRAQRPDDLLELYEACERPDPDNPESKYPPYYPRNKLAIVHFFETLPIRPEENNRLRVASDLYIEVIGVVKWSDGPWGHRAWKAAKAR